MSGLRSIVPGWLSKLGATPTAPPPPTGTAGKLVGLPGWLVRTGNDTNVVVSPLITSVSTLYRGATITVNGTNFGTATGQVFVGGVGQTIVSWSGTQVQFDFNLSYLKYGQYTLRLVSGDTGRDTTYLVDAVPPFGSFYVNLVEPLAEAQYRITAIPDLAGGDQLEWGQIVSDTGNATVVVNSDASFVASLDAQGFSVRVNDGTSWSAFAVQDLGLPGTPNVEATAVKYNGAWAELSSIHVNQNGVVRQALAGLVKQNGVWKRFHPTINPSPVAKITFPINGSHYNIVQDIQIRCSAYDDMGIDRVEFYVQKSGDPTIRLHATETGMTWYPDRYSTYLYASDPLLASSGTINVWARVYDINGAMTQTSTVSFSVAVNQIPVVNLTPLAGTVWGTVPVTATASDPDGTVASVELKYEPYGTVGSSGTVGTDTTAPYTWNWNTTGLINGTYQLSAKATDNLGAVSFAAQIVDVNNLAVPTLTVGTPQVNSIAQTISYPVSTNQASGTLYWIVTTNSTTPSSTQVVSGRDATNALAPYKGTVSASYVGTYTTNALVLLPGVTYYCYWVQVNTQSKTSTVTRQSASIVPSLAVSLNKTTVFGTGTEEDNLQVKNVTATTDKVIATITGAVGSATVSWEKLSGESATPSVSTDGYVFTRVYGVSADSGYAYLTGVYRAVVTDQGGNIAYSQNLTVNTEHQYIYTGLLP